MMLLIVILVCVSLVVLLVNWRWGIYLIVLAGFLQDPARKIIPDQPVYYSTTVIFVFGISLLLALVINNTWRVSYITMGNPRLEISIGLYVLFILFSSLYSYLSYGNITIALIGISLYIGPISAAVYASIIFEDFKYVRGFISFYLFSIVFVIVTIWLSVFGLELVIFEEIGGGIEIYEHSIRNYLDVHAGIVRTSELAAWHLATGACFSLILALQTKNTLMKFMLYLLTIACLLSGIFTGRRKMYVLFAAFCITLLFIVFYQSKGKYKNFVVISVSTICVVVVSLYMTFQKQILLLSFASNYLSRSFTLLSDISDRLLLTLNYLDYTIRGIELLGDGVGSSGQGVAGFSTGKVIWNSETGLGRLGNEFGVLGLLILFYMVVIVAAHIFVSNKILQRYDYKLSLFQRSLVAFLFANALNYFNAAQAYNDLFILVILGLVLGCVLATPKIFYNTAIEKL